MENISKLKDKYSGLCWQDLALEELYELNELITSILGNLRVSSEEYKELRFSDPQYLSIIDAIDYKRSFIMSAIIHKPIKDYELNSLIRDLMLLYDKANEFIVESEYREVGVVD